MSSHEWPEPRLALCQGCETVERPGADESLRKADVFAEDILDPARLRRCPLKQGERAHDLQANLPFVALGQRADEDPLVRLDPVTAFMRELLEQIDRALD